MAEEKIPHKEKVVFDLLKIEEKITSSLNLREVLDLAGHLLIDKFDLKFLWFALVEEGSFDVRSVASHGFEEGYLKSTRVTCDDSEHGSEPTGAAIKTKKPQVYNNLDKDHKHRQWCSEALKRGYRSSAAVPLIFHNKVIGALSVYSDKSDFFTEDIISTLQIYANCTAIAIENSSLYENVRRTKEHLESLINNMNDSAVVVDRDYKIVSINPFAMKMAKCEGEEIVGKRCYEVYARRNRPCDPSSCEVAEVLRTGKPIRMTHTRLDAEGNKYSVEVVASPIRDTEGNVIQILDIGRDITEEIKAEEELRERIRELENLHRAFVGRELKMLELKEEIKRLRAELENK